MKPFKRKRDEPVQFGGCLDLALVIVLAIAMGGACLVGMVAS